MKSKLVLLSICFSLLTWSVFGADLHVSDWGMNAIYVFSSSGVRTTFATGLSGANDIVFAGRNGL
jgi:hypothetical protein